jgi:hypothetical protein
VTELPKQTSPRNRPAVRHWGCRLFSLLGIPQLYTRQALSQEYIDAIVTMALANPQVLEETAATGTEEHVLINWGFWCLGFPQLRGRQVGQQVPGQPAQYWGGRAVAHQYSICHWLTTGLAGLGHWTLWDAAGEKELYDPWDPGQAVGIPGVPERWQIVKRRVDLRLLYYVWTV